MGKEGGKQQGFREEGKNEHMGFERSKVVGLRGY